MRILVDECLPRGLARLLAGHDVKTVPQAGWSGVKNGDLLARASGVFDIFITIDRSLTFQQNIQRFDLRLIVIHAKSNRLADIAPLVPNILAAINQKAPPKIMHVP